MKVNEIYDVISIERAYLAKTNEDSSLLSALVFPAGPDNGLHTDECSSQHTVYDKVLSKYAASVLVDDRQKNERTQYRARRHWYVPAEAT